MGVDSAPRDARVASTRTNYLIATNFHNCCACGVPDGAYLTFDRSPGRKQCTGCRDTGCRARETFPGLCPWLGDVMKSSTSVRDNASGFPERCVRLAPLRWRIPHTSRWPKNKMHSRIQLIAAAAATLFVAACSKPEQAGAPPPMEVGVVEVQGQPVPIVREA